MLLYEHPLSSYAQKVKIALREKGVTFDAELPECFGTGRSDRPFAATFAEFDAAASRMAAASERYIIGGQQREYRDHRLEWMVKSGGIEVVLAGLRDGNIRFPWPDGSA